MLGFLRGIEQSVAREGAAQRDHYGTLLSSKESHLDRLLNQIKYNQQMKRLENRDTRQDFVSDRAHDRGVLESDRTHAYREDRAAATDKQWEAGHKLRESADTRAGDIHDFNYGVDGYMRRRAEREGDIHDFNYGVDGLMPLRLGIFKNERDHLYGAGDQPGYRTLQRKQLTNEIGEWDENADVRDLTRQYQEKLGHYNLGQGWTEYLEERDLSQELTSAQIDAYKRRGTTTSGRSGPTWSQTQDITVENLAPVVLKHLEDRGEHAVMPWHKDAQAWPPGFKANRPFVSEDPNEVTQTKLLRQAGGYLVEELIARGVDPQTAIQMVPSYWDRILDTKGSDVLKRLERASQAEGYDDLELRKVLRDSVYRGAMNYLNYGQPERPEGVGGSEAEKLLDMDMGDIPAARPDGVMPNRPVTVPPEQRRALPDSR